VNANYRFVVSPSGGKGITGGRAAVPGATDTNADSHDDSILSHGYYAQATDPDQHVEWVDVLQVVASAVSQTQSCPICLSPPVAPRMARCGHMFCLPCLIRFAHSASDDETTLRKELRAKKCPLCDEHFRLTDTRPVRFYHGMENPLPKPGEDVVLRLMQREHGLVLALPSESGGADVDGLDAPWHYAANVLDYARVMKGTDSYMLAQHDDEMAALEEQAAADEAMFGPEEAEYVQRAMRAVEAAKARIAAEPRTVADYTSSSKGKHRAGSTTGGGGGGSAGAPPPYYFYMAPPHLYLAPLDIRILKTAFGGFSSFPATLLPRVEHISSKTMDETLRRRTKYLSHIPLGCVVSFLECDWADIVPPEVLQAFAPDLDRRRKQHTDKAVQEERERLDAERIDALEMGRVSPRRLAELVVRDDDFVPLGWAGTGAAAAASGPPPVQGERVGFDRLADMSTSPSGSRTVWGTPRVGGGGESVAAQQQVDDGWLNSDEVEDAYLATQLQAVHVDGNGGGGGGGGGSGSGGAGPGGGGGKKKKKQKITLMSTDMRRGG
jgi:uncharacterized membrane protein YgcG